MSPSPTRDILGSMRMPRAERRLAALLALLAAGSTAIVVATSGNSAGGTSIAAPGASAWRGLVGSRPAVALGSRVIIVLHTPSLAQRVMQNRGRAGFGHPGLVDHHDG